MISNSGTGTATTKDWLNATEGMKLTAYDPQSIPRAAISISMVLTSADVEMKPARRSLRDKAREEMSGFDRNYPW